MTGAPATGGSGHVASTVWSFGKQGFGHVIPAGLDHILFVLGLFLLGRSWGPLLWQVSAFTLAHSATLALVTLGQVSASPKVVEPLIAASIALVAFENIWKPVYSLRRLLVVFAFGLVHGLGFAGGLNDLMATALGMRATAPLLPDADDPPVAFINFDGTITANNGVPFVVQWNANGIVTFATA